MSSSFNRRDFLSKAFGATVLSFTAPVVLGELIPTLQAKGDTLSGIYTIKLSDYPALANVNGMVRLTIAGIGKPATGLPSNRKVIVIRESQTKFNAVYEVCPHENCNVNDFSTSKMRFVCGCHGAEFDITGAVKKNPANKNLHQFTTTFNASTGLIQIEVPNLTTEVNNSILLGNKASEVSIYAGVGVVTVSFIQQCSVTVAVHDINGNQLSLTSSDYPNAETAQEIKFELPTHSGTYFAAIKSSSGFNQVRKFVVVK